MKKALIVHTIVMAMVSCIHDQDRKNKITNGKEANSNYSKNDSIHQTTPNDTFNEHSTNKKNNTSNRKIIKP